jgi:hypothetical protein
MQEEWLKRAELALSKGDDELAREALKRKKAFQVRYPPPTSYRYGYTTLWVTVKPSFGSSKPSFGSSKPPISGFCHAGKLSPPVFRGVLLGCTCTTSIAVAGQ